RPLSAGGAARATLRRGRSALRAEYGDVERRALERVRVGDRRAGHQVRRHSGREPVHRRLRGDAADRELAIAGAGRRAVTRVAVIAGADDRRVADTAGVLVRPAARRHGRRDIAPGVQGEEVHGPALLADGLANYRQELRAAPDARRRLADRTEALHPALAGRWRQVLRSLRADLPREARSSVA